jgi:hypothetical protein
LFSDDVAATGRYLNAALALTENRLAPFFEIALKGLDARLRNVQVTSQGADQGTASKFPLDQWPNTRPQTVSLRARMGN